MLFCNLFETASASEWLLYISEWDTPGGGLPLSNIRVTTKVAVNALLGDTPALVDYGSALMSNLATKEVFDDESSGKILFHWKPGGSTIGEDDWSRAKQIFRHVS